MSPQMGLFTKQDDIAVMAAHTADLDAHTKNVWEVLRVGQYFSQWGLTATQNLTADKLYATPIIIVRDVTIDRLAVEVTVGDAGNFARIGIYNNGTNLYPGTLLRDYGVVDVGAADVLEVAVDQVLLRGIYWIAIVSDGTPQIRRAAAYEVPITILGIPVTDFSYKNQGWVADFVYAALHDPFTAGGVFRYLMLGISGHWQSPDSRRGRLSLIGE